MFIVLAQKYRSLELTFLLVLLVSYSAPGLSKNSDDPVLASDSGASTARLTIHSSPDGVAINIDGQFFGRTPIDSYRVQAGNHVLLGLHPDRTRWAAADWLQKITVRPGDSLYFHIDFDALTADHPTDADVRPFQAQGLATSNRNRPGLMPPDDPPAQQGLWQPPDSRSGAKTGSAQSWKKVALVTSVGVAVLSGLAAVHFRDQANSFYSSYQKSGNPAQMNHYFDKTQYYDRVSGIYYGVFQVSFMTSIYLYLSSGSK